jgi:hypothetical protein
MNFLQEDDDDWFFNFWYYIQETSYFLNLNKNNRFKEEIYEPYRIEIWNAKNF